MALILCPDCKNKVSDLALTCPFCGYPLSLSETERQALAQRELDDFQGALGLVGCLWSLAVGLVKLAIVLLAVLLAIGFIIAAASHK